MTLGPVYKLLSEADWAAARVNGETATAIDHADGYVHLSTRGQVEETARRYFTGAGRVRLLRFGINSLPPLRWESSRSGQFFPHLYAELRIDAAEAGWWLLPAPDGTPAFPAEF